MRYDSISIIYRIRQNSTMLIGKHMCVKLFLKAGDDCHKGQEWGGGEKDGVLNGEKGVSSEVSVMNYCLKCICLMYISTYNMFPKKRRKIYTM